MRWVIARVLPVPAPASTRTGPRSASATWRCSGSRASSRSGVGHVGEQLLDDDGWQRGRTVSSQPRRRRRQSSDEPARSRCTRTPWCGYCHRLKGQLDREGISLRRRRHRAAPRGRARSSSGPTTATRPSRRWSTPTAPRRPTRRWRRSRKLAAGRAGRDHHDPGSGPPYQCSTSERQIEMPPGSTMVPASASARICARVNHRASWISRPSTAIAPWSRRPDDPQHQAGRQRPGLVAEVARPRPPPRRSPRRPHGVRRPRASRRAREARERGVAPGRPGVLAAEQQGLVVGPRLAAGDRHDHGRVGARELAAVAVDALELVPGHPGLELASAARAAPGREQPLGQADGVEDERRLLDRRHPGQVREQPTQPDPVVAVRLTAGSRTSANQTRPVPFAEQHAQAVSRCLGGRHPRDGLVDGPHPGAGHDEHAGAGVGPRGVEPGLVGAALPHPVVGICGQLDVRVPHASQASPLRGS